MSTQRVDPKRGWVWNPKKLPQGPNGRALCRECQTEVPKGRRTFCSDKCVESWKLRTDPMFVRIQVFKRDKGVCALCRQDTVALAKELQALARSWDVSTYYRLGGQDWDESPSDSLQIRERYKKRLAELRLTPSRVLSSRARQYGIWDADHIVPVVEGGGLCDLSNYRTLCVKCHKDETAKLRTKLAAAKRAESSK